MDASKEVRPPVPQQTIAGSLESSWQDLISPCRSRQEEGAWILWGSQQPLIFQQLIYFYLNKKTLLGRLAGINLSSLPLTYPELPVNSKVGRSMNQKSWVRGL